MVPKCPTTFAAGSSCKWKGLLLSVVCVGSGVRYEGILCHVDQAGQRIFLGRAQRFSKKGVEEPLEKLLVISKGQVESIEIIDEELQTEDDWDEEDDDADTSEFDEVHGEDVVAQLICEEDSTDLVEVTPAQHDVEAITLADIVIGITAPVKPSFQAVLLQPPPADAVPAKATLKWLIQLPMTKWMIKHHPRQFPDYSIPDNIARILDHGVDRSATGLAPELKENFDQVKDLLRMGISTSNYKQYLTFLLYAEEFQMEQTIQNYDMYNVKIQKLPPNHPVCLKVPGLVDRNPNIIKGDTVCLKVGGKWYDLCTLETYKNEVHFERDKMFENEVFKPKSITEKICDVQFTVNQSTLRCMHRAIGILNECTVRRLFPRFAPPMYVDEDMVQEEDLKLFNESIKDNAEQMQAICHIVSGSSSPHPYLLFGPPGTGKTVTVVEAIKQVWRMVPHSRIIVSAPSNTATDLLASKLVTDIPERDILRLVAPSREGVAVDAAIEDIIIYGKVRVEKLLRYRIVVVTLSTSGRLFSAGIPMGHFTHLFVDEAGQATEPESIVPLAGLLDQDGHIILSGDPNQLGPVNLSDVAKKHGLDISLLERLMTSCEIYSRDKNGNRNPNCITKLLKNFRSHKKLLALPSKLFYDNELIAAAPVINVEKLCTLDWIPKNGFPIIFHGVFSRHQRGANSTSLFNKREVELVINYVTKLTKILSQQSIGIVSPYKRQVRMIKDELASKLQMMDILVGSTEEFQGQERDAMIVSTVRSSINGKNEKEDGGGGLGFLVNAKRFNVAISRAKALMIVIGDPHLLSGDKHWGELLKFVKVEGGYVGCNFNVRNKKKGRKKW